MYEPHYEEEAGGGGFLIGLLCGTALGAAIGLMFAPKAGSEFRQRLYDTTGDIRRKAYETYDQATEQINTAAAKATEQVNTVATKARQAVERGKEAFESARQTAAGQPTGGNGSASDFSNRPGVTDFNTGPRPTGGA
jgi:gas vesicle protein